MTGNTIKSKTLQEYIVDFMDKGLVLLLNGKGKEFVEYYYEYHEKIYNKEIPLSQIANKSRVKLTVDEYITRSKKLNKAGHPMSRMAHMELIIKENLRVNLGDTIYYVNNGTALSHGDVQTKTNKDGTRETILRCYRVNELDMTNNPEMKGDYNVARYVNIFNKRVEPLLVVFGYEIRDSLLVKKPEDRQFFTEKQCSLINGLSRKEGDQDTLEEVLNVSQEELVFWNKIGAKPEDFLEELGVLDAVRR